MGPQGPPAFAARSQLADPWGSPRPLGPDAPRLMEKVRKHPAWGGDGVEEGTYDDDMRITRISGDKLRATFRAIDKFLICNKSK